MVYGDGFGDGEGGDGRGDGRGDGGGAPPASQILRSLELTNFTAFKQAKFEFAPGLNVLVGENGTGKTHVLKLAYSIMAASVEQGVRGAMLIAEAVTPDGLARKLVGVFRPDRLGRLVWRPTGRRTAEVSAKFASEKFDLRFQFASQSDDRVDIVDGPEPTACPGKRPVFIPTRELLSLGPKFVSLYDEHYVDFEETWRDTCRLLGVPLQRGPKEARAKALLEPLSRAMGGYVWVERATGRLYFTLEGSARDQAIEIPLLSEGLRKLGMIAYLVSNGTLLDQGFLFWDEPEANLNPKLIRATARAIVALCEAGIQIFLATHSMFLLRELEMVPGGARRYFGLRSGGADEGVLVTAGDKLSDIGDITALDEEIEQSDDYLAERSRR